MSARRRQNLTVYTSTKSTKKHPVKNRKSASRNNIKKWFAIKPLHIANEW